MFHSDFRQLLVILLKLWLNFRDKPAAESGLLPLPIPFARKKIVDSEVWIQYCSGIAYDARAGDSLIVE